MKITQENLNKLLIKEKDESVILGLLLEFGRLKLKLENILDESWYTQKAGENLSSRLEEIALEYASIRKLFNRSSIDDLISELAEAKRKQHKHEQMESGFIKITLTSENKRRIQFVNELIGLKSKTSRLDHLQFYMENPDEFLIFIH
ncbi:MAG TPA: hypothetical protein VFF21_01425 [Flavobacteriaceae bacterium]|nr:hypothetical protein [Flavobacteriaceae bacterium]